MSTAQHRRTRAGGAKKRPTRYTEIVPDASLRAALHAHKKGSFALARARYRASVQAGETLDALVNLGAVEVQLGHAALARDALVRARALGEGNARALRDIGIALHAIGYTALAIDALSACVATDPSQIGAWLVLSRAHADQGAHDRAIEVARVATERAPGDPSSWLERHRAERALSDPEPAWTSVERALALDPAYAHAAIAHAAIALELGRDSPLDSLSERWRDAVSFAAERVRAEGARAIANKSEGLRVACAARASDGPACELGVRFGVSTRVLASACAEVHGFDSFEGLPEAFASMPEGAFSMDQCAPELPSNVRLHVGWFDATLPPFVAQLERAPSLVHIDSDLYSSAKCALDHLGPRVEPGCVLVFDELIGNEDWRAQEHRALREAADRLQWKIEWLSISALTGQAVVRVR